MDRFEWLMVALAAIGIAALIASVVFGQQATAAKCRNLLAGAGSARDSLMVVAADQKCLPFIYTPAEHVAPKEGV